MSHCESLLWAVGHAGCAWEAEEPSVLGAVSGQVEEGKAM